MELTEQEKLQMIEGERNQQQEELKQFIDNYKARQKDEAERCEQLRQSFV